jgi:hypothetical protein
MSNDFWSIEDVEFLNHLHAIANHHRAECISPLMAEEDRLEEQEALNVALLAIESFEACKTQFIESLEKSVAEDEDEDQQQNL